MKGQGTGDNHLANKCRQTEPLPPGHWYRVSGQESCPQRSASLGQACLTLLGDDIPRSHLSADAVLWGLRQGTQGQQERNWVRWNRGTACLGWEQRLEALRTVARTRTQEEGLRR